MIHDHIKHIHGRTHMKHGRDGRGRGGGPGRRGRGRGSRHVPPAVTTTQLSSWFAGALPDDWFTEPVSLVVDRDEIIVTGSIPMPKVSGDADPALAAQSRIQAFREETRDARMAVADRAQHEFERTVSWAVTCGSEEQSFTRASVPVMTRLHHEDRQVLDTLIDAGVARSRSEALAWCVRLVGENESGWIDKLRDAMTDIEKLRNEGPASRD